MEPTHFLLDIDGCLRAGRINELPGLTIIQHYVARAEQEGLPLISLCTGRGRGYGEAIHQNIGAPDTFSIFENGCFMERISSTPRELVEHEKVKENRSRFSQIASSLAAYADQKGYYREPKEIMVTISVKGTGKPPNKLEKEIKAVLKKRGWLDLVSVTHSTTAVDVTPYGVTKATGVVFFARRVGFEVMDLCGVGDSEADCEFLKLVGYAGCPLNAQACVQKVVEDKISEYGPDHGFVAHRPDIYGVVEILEHFNKSKGVHLLESMLPPLSMVQAIRDRATFMATRATKTTLTDPHSVLYEIEKDPHVATSQDERKLLESPTDGTDGTLWRWPAGGALFVLKVGDKYLCPVVLRDARAPVDPWCFGTGAGLGASEDDFLFPNRVAVREAMEEMIICIGRHLAYPFIRDDKWGGMNLAIERIARKNQSLASKFGQPHIADVVSLPARLIELGSDTRYTTKWQNKVLQLPGIFVEDKGSGAVDYLCAIEMDLQGYRADEVVLLDGEIQGSTPLCREMYLFELVKTPSPTGYDLGKTIGAFRGGESIVDSSWPTCEKAREVDRVRLTPGLARILECLPLLGEESQSSTTSERG